MHAAVLHMVGTAPRYEEFPEPVTSDKDREAIVHVHAASLKPVGNQLEDQRQVNELGRSIPELAVSFIHMHLNRMLRSAHHKQETVLYDLLARTYASGLASERRLTT